MSRAQARGLRVSERTKKLVCDLYRFGITDIFYEWLENGMKEDLEAQIRRLSLLFTGNIRASLSRYRSRRKLTFFPGGTVVSAGFISPAKELCHAILDHLSRKPCFPILSSCAPSRMAPATRKKSAIIVLFAAEHHLRCIQDATPTTSFSSPRHTGL